MRLRSRMCKRRASVRAILAGVVVALASLVTLIASLPANRRERARTN